MRGIRTIWRVVALAGMGLGLAATGGAQDSWTATSTTGAPSSRFPSNTLVWTGNKMIVWGGSSAQDSLAGLNTGGLYDPAANTWTATSLVGAPGGRASHTAVWTGARMIVWGGSTTSTDGGLYDPATNTWAPTSTTGAPAARFLHTAVWTGSKMIVWGGKQSLSSNFNTGGIYDPATNTWSAMSTASAPAARFGHTAVWTGSKMIVWGGQTDLVGPHNSGGVYDPATDTWTATSTASTPTARFGHTAVWTGSKMVVWGGDGQVVVSGVTELDTGAVYDPATDTWTPTTTVGAPTRRDLHTAVWSGSRMIVWGGKQSSTSSFNTGGIYDPAANSWTATTTVGAPSSRGGHGAVWTSTKMIVWGGGSGTTFGLSTGGVYDPGAQTSLLSIGDVGATEGATALLTVTLAPASAQTVTVDYATANGTATAPADYLAASGTVTFAPGETSKQVSVSVNADVLDEPAETFFVNLTNPTNATIADGQGQATINQPLRFFSSNPCRILDTRDPAGPLGGPILSPGQQRSFTVTGGACVVPATAKALSVNLTVVNPTGAGFVTVFPGDGSLPPTSSINFSAGQVRANNGVFRLAGDGSGRLNIANGSSGSTHVLLDVNGYFE